MLLIEEKLKLFGTNFRVSNAYLGIAILLYIAILRLSIRVHDSKYMIGLFSRCIRLAVKMAVRIPSILLFVRPKL